MLREMNRGFGELLHVWSWSSLGLQRGSDPGRNFLCVDDQDKLGGIGINSGTVRVWWLYSPALQSLVCVFLHLVFWSSKTYLKTSAVTRLCWVPRMLSVLPIFLMVFLFLVWNLVIWKCIDLSLLILYLPCHVCDLDITLFNYEIIYTTYPSIGSMRLESYWQIWKGNLIFMQIDTLATDFFL